MRAAFVAQFGHTSRRKMKQKNRTRNRCKPEIIEAILKEVSEGKPLRQACREGKDRGYPPESSFREMCRADESLAAAYAHARALQIDALADELLVVSYDPNIEPANKRVITENIRWLLSRLRPQRFGDRLLLAGSADEPLQVLHKQADLATLSDDQLEALQGFTSRMLIEHQPEPVGAPATDD
jgi:hypothetical protein